MAQKIRFHFDGNAASSGAMKDQKVKLPAKKEQALRNNEFERTGYIFVGWNTEKDGSGRILQNRNVVKENDFTDGEQVTFYAQWKPCVWIARFFENGTDKVKMSTAIMPFGKTQELPAADFAKEGFAFDGWNTLKNGLGRKIADAADARRGLEGKIFSHKICEVECGPVKKKVNCSQGSCIAKKDGKLYALVCFIRNSPAFKAGDDSDYDSSVVLYDMDSKKTVKSVEGLFLDHANGVCYNPEKERFYIVRLGQNGREGGIVEMDWDLNVTNDIMVKGAEHLGNITYFNKRYYGLVPRKAGFQFTVLDENLELTDEGNDENGKPVYVDGYNEAAYTGQGFGTDGTYIYGIAADFKDSMWRRTQRLYIYDFHGKLLGCQKIDIPHEVEDITFVDGTMYVSTNGHDTAGIYTVDLGGVDLYAQWS